MIEFLEVFWWQFQVFLDMIRQSSYLEKFPSELSSPCSLLWQSWVILCSAEGKNWCLQWVSWDYPSCVELWALHMLSQEKPLCVYKQITMCCVVSKEESVHSDPLNSLLCQLFITIHPHKPDSCCTNFMENVVSLLSISSAYSPKYLFDFHHATKWVGMNYCEKRKRAQIYFWS